MKIKCILLGCMIEFFGPPHLFLYNIWNNSPQQFSLGLGLVVEVSRSHTDTSDQLITEVTIYTTHNKHKG